MQVLCGTNYRRSGDSVSGTHSYGGVVRDGGGVDRCGAWGLSGDGVRGADCSEQEFVRVGYEIEEGVEIGLVFPFIQPVEIGSLFRARLVFFFLFDE